MARTLRGNMTGRAAATELAEQHAALYEAAAREREARRIERIERRNALYRRLIELDPEGGEEWYDDDANVHPFNLGEQITALEKRVEELQKQQLSLAELVAMAYGQANLDGSDTSTRGQLRDAGFGEDGRL